MATQTQQLPTGQTGQRHIARPTGWAVFAGMVLLMVGLFNVVYGLVALLNSPALTVSSSGVIVWDLKSWGWTMLALGGVQALVGISLLYVKGWARWFAIGFAVVNAVAWMGLINAYPFWAITIIALDVLVIYNLSAHWQPETSSS